MSEKENKNNFDEIKDKRPSKAGEFVGKEEEGENYYVKLDEERVYELAPIAYYVWSMCTGEKTVSEIVQEISEEAQLPQDQVREPVAMIINELAKVSLVNV
jgi:hypothetical protein